MHKYEFKRLINPSEDELNALGAEGYRIVSSVVEPILSAFNSKVVSFDAVIVYLQRKVQPAPRIPSYTDAPWNIPAKEDS